MHLQNPVKKLAAIAIALVGLSGLPAVLAAPFAYVGNAGDNTVSVIDTASNSGASG